MACRSPADKATTCGWPVRHPSQSTPPETRPNQTTSPRRIDGRAAVGTGLERRHQPQLAQAGQLEPEHPPRPQVRLAQMPQGDPRRVEQPGVRVVQVGQLVQQLGDVIAGIQGRQIAAERCEALHRRGLDHEVHRLGRLGNQHDIGNPHQVKATLEPRLRPPRPLGQRADLPQLAGEERHHQAGLEDLDRPQDQGQRSRSDSPACVISCARDAPGMSIPNGPATSMPGRRGPQNTRAPTSAERSMRRLRGPRLVPPIGTLIDCRNHARSRKAGRTGHLAAPSQASAETMPYEYRCHRRRAIIPSGKTSWLMWGIWCGTGFQSVSGPIATCKMPVPHQLPHMSRRSLQPDRSYVMDRLYAEFALWNASSPSAAATSAASATTASSMRSSERL